MISKVSFNELMDAYGLDANGNLVNGIDPIAYIDSDDNIVKIDFFNMNGS